jgi:hypothetical protein
MKVLMGVLLDRSGSMAGKESDVIGGVNRFITEQQKVEGEASLLLARFDTEYEIFRLAQPIKSVQPLRAEEYQPRGQTALLDALGRTINELERLRGGTGAPETTERESIALRSDTSGVRRSAPAFDRVIVVVATDGLENASREFSRERIKAMVSGREGSGWTFIYIGAHVDAFTEARSMGFTMNNTGVTLDSKSMARTYGNVVAQSVSNIRTGKTTDAGLGRDITQEANDPQQP